MRMYNKIGNFAVLSPLKVRRHIPIILLFFLLFTKDLKEVHIIESHIWIDREVANSTTPFYDVDLLEVFSEKEEE